MRKLLSAAGWRRPAAGAALAMMMGMVGIVFPVSPTAASLPPEARAAVPRAGDVRVMYPASLTGVMEDWVGPAFERATGYTFLGEGSGSLAMTNLVKDHIKFPDVFVSSDPSADTALQGPANGGFVSWWVGFASSQLVLAWNAGSVFAPSFTRAKEQLITPESVLELPGLRFCRADPALDPEGYQTLFAFDLDQARSGQAGLERSVLGPDANLAQIFPEEVLGARLQSGACDAGVFYEVEALSDALPFLTLPAEVNLGDPANSALYATASFRAPGGQRFTGAPITFTITIPTTTGDAAGAVAFVRFLLGPAGQRILGEQGLAPIPFTAGGDASRVPAGIEAQLAASAPAPAGLSIAPATPSSPAPGTPTGLAPATGPVAGVPRTGGSNAPP